MKFFHDAALFGSGVALLSVAFSSLSLIPWATNKTNLTTAPLGVEEHLLVHAGGTALSSTPPLWTLDALLLPEELDALLSHISSGELHFRANIFAGEGEQRCNMSTVGKSYASLDAAALPRLRPFLERIDRLFGADVSSGETPLVVVRTAPGTPRMLTHHDQYQDASRNDLTVNVYLTSAVHADSGRVEFEKAGVSVLPQAGTVLLFENSHPDAVHSRSPIHPDERERLHMQIGLKRVATHKFHYSGAVEPGKSARPDFAPDFTTWVSQLLGGEVRRFRRISQLHAAVDESDDE